MSRPAMQGDLSAAAVLAGAVVPQVARAFALVDRNPLSATHGCGDRAYWHYRTLTNFPGASWQQLMLGFAALHRADVRDNPHRGDPELLDLTAAMLRFWATGCQNRSGAFDEWYLNEYSFCATAITSAGVGLTLHLLGDALQPEDRDVALSALARSGSWLESRYNPVVMNQNLAAATARRALAVLTGQDRWAAAAKRMLERVGREQSAEGWLPEYSGADLGYSTLSLDQLAAYRWLAGEAEGPDRAALDMAGRLTDFLARMQAGRRTLPGALGSRGTHHQFPFGALAFSRDLPGSAGLAQAWVGALGRGEAAGPADCDDRYFAYFYFPQFALALYQASLDPAPAPARDDAPDRFPDLPESGFLACPLGRGTVTVSRRLGGALAVEGPTDPCRFLLGYEAKLADGRRFSSATWETGKVRSSGELAAPGGLLVEAPFRSVKSSIPLRRMMIPFQILIHLLRTSALAERFQGFVKERMVSSKNTLPLLLRRRIEVTGDALRVSDELVPAEPLPNLRSLAAACDISMHSPSAKTRPPAVFRGADEDLARALGELQAGRPAVIDWRLDVTSRTESGAVAPSARGS